MKAITEQQPFASLIAVGAKSILTRSWSTDYRGSIAIHAGKQWQSGWVGDWYTTYATLDGAPWGSIKGTSPSPLPFGAVVASATLIDVVPIIVNCGIDMEAPPHLCVSPTALLLHRPESDPFPGGDTERVVTSERPFGLYEHGRFALLLGDVKPTTERCPWCRFRENRGDVRTPGYVWARDVPDRVKIAALEAGTSDVVEPCPVCERRGSCDPVPAKGKQGLWSWTPEKVPA